jgi:hypothetical protein
MREALLDYIKGLNLLSYKETKELPYTNSDTPLYIKNSKRIYVDEPQVNVEPFIQILNGNGLDNEITSIRVYFSNDAKNPPSDYSNTVVSLKKFKNLYKKDEYYRSESLVETNYENDLNITVIEFRFIKLLERN